MALQAGLATSKILIILGASVAGSILIQNGNLKDFLGDSYKVLVKHLKQESEKAGQNSADPKLVSQLNRLRQELVHLTPQKPSITVISGSSNSYGNLISMAVPALLIGATGYGYIRWKGISLSDFMYVTRRNMSDAVTNVSKQLENVSSALSVTKQQINARLENLSNNLDQNMEMQHELQNEVVEVRGVIAKHSLEIERVQKLMHTLGMKIDTIESKQEMANKGVVYLCNYAQKLQITQPPEIESGVQRPRLENASASGGVGGLKGVQRPRLENASASGGVGGLKELRRITNALECPDPKMESKTLNNHTEVTLLENDVPSEGLTSRLQRTFTANLPAGFTSCRAFYSRS